MGEVIAVSNATIAPPLVPISIARFSPRPLIIIASRGDSFFPPESVRSLYEHAREPRELIWHGERHIMPWQMDRIRELTEVVAKRLFDRGPLPGDSKRGETGSHGK